MEQTFKALARDVIQLAQQMGAETVAVSIGTARSLQVEARQQQIDSLKESGSSRIYVAISQKQRRSSISSNDLRLSTLEPLLRSTMEALPYMGADEFYSLPDPALQGRAKADLQLTDPEFDRPASPEKIARAFQLEAETLAQDPRLKSEQAYYSDTTSYGVYADSNGFLDDVRNTFFSLGMSAFVEDQDLSGLNTARKQTDGWYTCSRFYHQLENSEVVARKTAQRVLRKIGAVKPKSQEVPVVFSPEMARSFWGSVASAMMGDQIFRKQSFLAEKLGQAIAHEGIQVWDDPLLPGKMGSRYFDSEGVKAQPLMLIEKGILKNFMLSTYSAKKLGMQTTGHSGGISNLVLAPGPYDEEELIASVPHGLYLTFMSGQGANLTTGDYSRGAQGLWIREGKLAEPVSEFTIASTFLDMLSNLKMIANQVDSRSAILSPAFKIERMTISGA